VGQPSAAAAAASGATAGEHSDIGAVTLILGMMNRRQVVLVSDRRLSVDGQMREDESNKAAIFTCADGRLAIAFTGLAKFGGFVTNRWMLEAFSEAVEPEYRAIQTIQRVAELATLRFRALKTPRHTDKRLTIVCGGYTYEEPDKPRGLLAFISNFERLEGGATKAPNDEFMADVRVATLAESNPMFCVAAGIDQAISDGAWASLRSLLIEGRPRQAIVGKAVEVIRTAAESPRAQGAIGKQCTSIVLPGDLAESERVEFHSAHRSEIIYGVSHVDARGPGRANVAIADPERGMIADGKPMILAGPKLGRNQRCWCGSRHSDGRPKKYKQCHGR
jgi:hypothetical protein